MWSAWSAIANDGPPSSNSDISSLGRSPLGNGRTLRSALSVAGETLPPRCRLTALSRGAAVEPWLGW